MLFWIIVIVVCGFALLLPKLKYRKNVKDLDKKGKLQGENSEIYYDKGVIHYENENYERAMEEFNKALEADEKYYKALMGSGMAREKLSLNSKELEKKKLLKEAIEDYSKAIEINPAEKKIYELRGLSYYNNFNDEDKALEDLMRSVEIEVENEEVREILTNIWFDKKMYSEIISYYSKLIEKNNNNATYFEVRGNAYNKNKEYEKSINDYLRALDLDRKNENVYVTELGEAYFDSENYETAISYLTKSIEIHKDNAFAYNLRGACYEKLKDYNRAVNDFKECLEIYKFKNDFYMEVDDNLKRVEKLITN